MTESICQNTAQHLRLEVHSIRLCVANITDYTVVYTVSAKVKRILN